MNQTSSIASDYFGRKIRINQHVVLVALYSKEDIVSRFIHRMTPDYTTVIVHPVHGRNSLPEEEITRTAMYMPPRQCPIEMNTQEIQKVLNTVTLVIGSKRPKRRNHARTLSHTFILATQACDKNQNFIRKAS